MGKEVVSSITARYRMDEVTYRPALRLWFRVYWRSGQGRLCITAMLALMVIGLYVLLTREVQWEGVLALVLFTMLLPGLFLTGHVSSWQAMRRYRKLPGYNSEVKLILQADDMHVVSKHSEGTLKWEAIQRAALDDNMIILFIPSGGFMFIPREVLDPAHGYPVLKQWIKAKIPTVYDFTEESTG